MTSQRKQQVLVAAVLVLAAVLGTRHTGMLGRGSALADIPQRETVHAASRIAAWFHGIRAAFTQPDQISALEVSLADSHAIIASLEHQLEISKSWATETAHVSRDAWPAVVVAGTFLAPDRTLTISFEYEGVEVGDAVTSATHGGALIGIVRSVGARRAIVALLSNSGTRLSAQRATLAGAVGVIESSSGGGLTLTHIPIAEDVVAGDAILTAPLNGALPAGIPIGMVSDVRVDPDGFFRSAAVDPFVDPRMLSVVSVIHRHDAQ
ncbi:MAG: rod shape-determining protein MreC [Candidatus Uhrbacteria bacterium]